MAESGFQTITLGDLIDSGVVEVTTGFPFGGHNVNANGVPHIRPFNVGADGEIYLDQIKFIPAAAAADKPTLQRNDIVFNNTNTKELVGKCALWSSDEQPVFSNHMTRIRVVDASCDPAYLSLAILHHWMAGKSQMLARSHVAQASIIGSRFREIEVPWPAPAAQRDISSLIRWVRAASRSEADQLANAKALKNVVMVKLFTRGLRGEPQKETEIGPVPESWEVATLGSLCNQNGGRIQTGPFGSQLHAHEYQADGTPVINPTHLEGNRINHADVPRVSAETACRLDRHKVERGDILFGRRGEIGRHGLVSQAEAGWLCGTGCFLVRVRHEGVDNAFLSYLFSTESLVAWLIAHAAGTIMPNLNNVILSCLPVVVPSLDEQRDIVAILDAIDRKIELHRKKRAVLEELFKALLHKLMTGEIRVDQLDVAALTADEAPASARVEAGV